MKKFFNAGYGLIIGITVIITVFLGWQLKDVRINNDVRIFLPKTHQSNLAFEDIENKFGGTDRIIVGVEVKEGTVYNDHVFEIIAKLTDNIEQVDGVHSVLSITGIDFVDGDENGVVVSKLAEDNGNGYDYELIDSRIESWKIFKDNIISQDKKLSGIVINLKSKMDIKAKQRIFKEVEKITSSIKDSNINIYITGEPAIIVMMGRFMIRDIIFLIPFVIVVLIIVLFFAFGNFGGIFYPLLTVVISSIWTIGLMTLMGFSLSLVATVIPVLLIAVGSAYGIHLVTHYYDGISKESNFDKDRNASVVIESLKKIFTPLTLSALTTIAGFGSLATSEINPIKTFGIFTALGVFFSYLITILLVPAILIHRTELLKKLPKINFEFQMKDSGIADKITSFILKIIKHHKKAVLIVCIPVFILSAYFTTKLIIESSIIQYFKESTPLRVSDRELNKKLGGTFVIDVKIAGKESGDIKDYSFLNDLDGLSSMILEKYSDKVGKVIAFTEIVKRLNEVMHYDEPCGGKSFYEIPSVPEKYRLSDENELNSLISEYLLFYDGDLSTIVDDVFEPMETRIIIQIKTLDSTTMRNIKKDIRDNFNKHFDTEKYKLTVSGWADIQLAVNDLIVSGQIWNIVTSLLAVILIIGVTFRSLKTGILGIVPIIVSVLTNFGIMGLFGIKLDIGTSMISAIAIGTGIDYSIHIISEYYHEYKVGFNKQTSVDKIIRTTGKAIIYNAFSVCAGFSVLLFSNFVPLVYLGLLISVTMITTSFSALIIMPIIFELFYKKERESAKNSLA